MISLNPLGWESRRLSSDEIPRDVQMPQLAMAVCPIAMKELLSTEIPQLANGSLGLRNLEVVFARYKPPRNCHVFYQLELVDHASGNATTAWVGAKFFSKGLTAGYMHRRTAFMRSDGLLPAWLHVPNLNAILTFFPNDLKLPRLDSLFRARDLRSALESARTPFDCALEDDGCPAGEVVSYRPERYCFVRLMHQESTRACQPVIYGRMLHTPEEVNRLHSVMSELWNLRHKSGLQVAEPLGCEVDMRMTFQSSVAGSTLTGALNKDNCQELMQAAAESLSRIHACSVTTDVFDEDAELSSFKSGAEALQRIAPDQFPNVDDLVDRLANNRSSRRSVMAFVHGDFSTNQLLMQDKQLGVIDFGSCRVADTHRDVANCFVRLENHLTGDLLRNAQQAFVREYRERHASRFDEQTFVWQQSRAFLKEGLVAFRKLKPGWRQRTQRCLNRADELLSSTRWGVLQ